MCSDISSAALLLSTETETSKKKMLVEKAEIKEIKLRNFALAVIRNKMFNLYMKD